MKCEELILERAVKTNREKNSTPISEVNDEDVNAVGYYNNNRGGFSIIKTSELSFTLIVIKCGE